MSTIEDSIEIEVPVRMAYNQWTQFESFPEFMEGVDRVTQMDDKRLHWVADVLGVKREWDAEIVEQIPDRRIAWRALRGEVIDGVVDFEDLSDGRCRVTLRIDHNPKDFVEKVGETFNFVERRVNGDLQRFKDFIESMDSETGAWRGKIDNSSE